MQSVWSRGLRLGGALLGVYLAARYVLPLVTPFVLGLALALAAEPMAGFFSRRCRMPRRWASAAGVALTLCLLVLTVATLCSLALRELSALAGVLPELEDGVRSGMGRVSGWLMSLADRAPEGLRALLRSGVTELFSGGSALLDRATDFLLRLASGILSRVPGGALSIATGVISAFMFSAKLPAIGAALRSRIPGERLRSLRAGMSRIRSALAGWLKAQARLAGVTFVICAAVFLLLGVKRALLWAVLVALVDALPILGSGAVLVPWSLVSFLGGDPVRAFALLGTYAAAAVTRSVLEPRLVGRQLGLDPLVTLISLYTGYRLLGIAGMLLAPMVAAAASQFAASGENEG